MTNTTEQCLDVPRFDRLRYFYGQVLAPQDLQREQAYFRDKLKLRNRCLHGYGTICGLWVEPDWPDEKVECAEPDAVQRQHEEHEQVEQELQERKRRCMQQLEGATGNQHAELCRDLAAIKNEIEEHAKRGAQQGTEREDSKKRATHKLAGIPKDRCGDAYRTKVRVQPGIALDCCGNELVVRQPVEVDLLERLSAEDRAKVQAAQGGITLYVSLCYCEQPIEPVRPAMQDECGTTVACTHAKLRDSFSIRVTTQAPAPDRRCNPCCEPCEDACLLLAVIHCLRPGLPLLAEQLDNSARRMLALYEPTTITGIGWVHGGRYRHRLANQLLCDGLRIRFSQPVHVDTVQPGVVDVWVITGGGGVRNTIYNVEGVLTPVGEDCGFTAEIMFRQTKGADCVNEGDRVLVVVRTDFILDRCCRPVDGNHVGGRVPLLADCGHGHPRPDAKSCRQSPTRYGPWTSGNGSPGGTFESWFWVDERTSAAQKGSP